MDGTTIVTVIGIVAILFIVGFVWYRRFSGSVKLPGLEVTVGGSNEAEPTTPAIEVRSVKAGRNAKVADATGRGVRMDEVEAEQDVTISVGDTTKKA